MKRHIILYGAGQCGKEALKWFGADNVELFIDNNKNDIGSSEHGLPIITFKEYLGNYRNAPDTDLVISIANKWIFHQIAYELEKKGFDNYSVFCDIKRRWKMSSDFMERDTVEYPCEHESVDKIRLAQNKWLLRHTDASCLTPAVSKLREKQLRILEYTIEAFKEFENELGIKLVMEAGTLLGAIRHKGFIPWDYDLDFCLPRHQYNRLKEYLEKTHRVYALKDKEPSRNSWHVIGEGRKTRYDVYENYGEITLSIYDDIFHGFNTLNNNRFVDITPLDTFAGEATIDDYKMSIEAFRGIWNKGGDFRQMVDYFHKAHPELSRAPVKGDKLGRATDVAVGCAYVCNPGRWFDKQLYAYEDIYEPIGMKFENVVFLAPANYDSVTKKMYGDDYMELTNRYGVHKEDPNFLFTEVY